MPADSPQMIESCWGWECQTLKKVNLIDDAKEAAIDLQAQLEAYAISWLNRSWNLQEVVALLEAQQNRLFLVTADNGSHRQLDAELPGSPIRQTHISMAQEAIANDKE